MTKQDRFEQGFELNRTYELIMGDVVIKQDYIVIDIILDYPNESDLHKQAMQAIDADKLGGFFTGKPTYF